MTTTGPGPGWFPDPDGSGGQRYFDGTAWTEHRAPPPTPYPPYAPYAPVLLDPGLAGYPGYGPWGTPPWKGADLGRPRSGPGALAEPGRRLAGRLLDFLLLLGVFAVLAGSTVAITAPHYGPFFPRPSDNATADAPVPGFVWLYVTMLGCALLMAVISIAYETVAITRYGRTFGCKWVHIRPLRTDGTRVKAWRALARSTFRVAAEFLSWIGLLNPLWCLWDDKRQCLHDKVADTIVVNDPSPGDPVVAPPEHGPVPVGVAPVPSWPPYGYVPALPRGPKTNTLAIVSLVCSVASPAFLGLPAIAGVVLGFVSQAQIRRSHGAETGSGIALCGIIVGFAVVVLITLVLVLPVVFSTGNTVTSLRASSLSGPRHRPASRPPARRTASGPDVGMLKMQ